MDQNKEKVFVSEDKLEMGDEQERKMAPKALPSKKYNELKKQVTDLQTFLSANQEKIATLRNKVENTPSTKTGVDETVLEQKNELKKLKDMALDSLQRIGKTGNVSDEIKQQIAAITAYRSAEGGVDDNDDKSRG